MALKDKKILISNSDLTLGISSGSLFGFGQEYFVLLFMGRTDSLASTALYINHLVS